MKTLILLSLCLLLQPTDKHLKIDYDRIEDRSRVTTKPQRVGDGFGLKMFAFVSHKGKELTEPIKDVLLVLDSQSRTWQFLKPYQQKLYVLADEQRFEIAGTVTESKIRENRPFNRFSGVYERIAFKLTPEDMEQLANSTTVEMKVGDHSFTLGRDTHESFRQLVIFLKQQSP